MSNSSLTIHLSKINGQWPKITFLYPSFRIIRICIVCTFGIFGIQQCCRNHGILSLSMKFWINNQQITNSANSRTLDSNSNIITLHATVRWQNPNTVVMIHHRLDLHVQCPVPLLTEQTQISILPLCVIGFPFPISHSFWTYVWAYFLCTINTFCFMRYPYAFHLCVFFVHCVGCDMVGQIAYTQNHTQILKRTHHCIHDDAYTNTCPCQ